MACNATAVTPAVVTGTDRPGMRWIPGGTFLMGSDTHYSEEAPAHSVSVDAFWMDEHSVTNREFDAFVKATNYVTLAERPVNAADYPGARPEMLVPSSVVFVPPERRVDMGNAYNWWHYIAGANWRHPRGPGTSLKGIWNHPVVHVGFEDAQAYARWVGKELPTEAEWEFAARGGLDAAEFVWGSELNPNGRSMANTWQGDFPHKNTLLDGYAWTSPVGNYPANGYGLYDMAGNVMEWVADWYSETYYQTSPASNPLGPDSGSDPNRVLRGGSWISTDNMVRAASRYWPWNAFGASFANIETGFRCALRISP